MNGTVRIIEGDNEKVHAWFTEHDRLYACHCDSCSAERTRGHDLRIRKEIRNKKIYNATGFVACVAIPLAIIAMLTLLISKNWLAGGIVGFALTVISVATIVICMKTNPWR